MKEFLSFRYMITPDLIKIICYIGMVVAFIAGIGMCIMADPLSGIGLIILGPLAVHMYSELMLIAFEIHGELKRINNSSE